MNTVFGYYSMVVQVPTVLWKAGKEQFIPWLIMCWSKIWTSLCKGEIDKTTVFDKMNEEIDWRTMRCMQRNC